mmetsp:Transcript_32521/g.44643  ORF Transcript_32521/g.44643 Transcript_32521/m.44643 type:complete len:359 (+) Transcript_32521:40-1116(+)
MGEKTVPLLLIVGFAFLLNSRFLVVESTTCLSWVIWTVDDILTHFLTESSNPIIFQLKCWIFELNENLQPSNYLKPTPVPELKVEDYSFEQVNAAVDEPLVIRGMFSGAPALTKWKDIEYLNQTIGDIRCPVTMSNHDHFESQRESILYRDIFNKLTRSGKNESKSPIYVSGDQFVFTLPKGEELLRDLQLGEYLGQEYMDSPLYSKEDLYLFVGANGRSGTSWHCAPNRSMFLLILGKKKWTFIHSRYSVLLRPQRSHLYSRIFLAFKSFQNFINQEEKNQGREDAGVHMDGSLFQHIPRSTVTLEPGDVLFVPSWYWHHVENVDSGEGKESPMTIGVDVDTHVWNHAWMNAFFPPT